MRLGDVLQLVDVLDARPLLDLGGALVGERRRLGLLVDGVVVLGDQPGDQPSVRVVLLGGLVALAADDQWGARLVDEDGVDLVDDRVVKMTLHAAVERLRHVVAQVVEAELVVGRVRDVGGIRLAPRAGSQVLQARVRVGLVKVLGVVDEREVLPGDHADGHAEQVV